jgi:hypothetical protein
LYPSVLVPAIRSGANVLIALAALAICVLLPRNSAAATTQSVWVFPSPSFPNPVTDPNARQALVAHAAASHVDFLYVSVYSSTPNTAGRYMYDEAAIGDLIVTAHGAGLKLYAAYGAPDWPTFGCGGFPLARMAEVTGYNNDHPSAKFDGVALDVEPPEPQSTAAYQALLAQYQCIRDSLGGDVALSVAIRFFWDQQIQYPPNTGATKPVYAHIIDMNLRNVVVMGYRDFAGPRDCSNDGIICLDQNEISYAASIGKFDVLIAGVETIDPAIGGISNRETFFEEGESSMNATAQTVLDHFGVLNGLGGFAIHNYQNSYLSGSSPSWPVFNSSFPTAAHEMKITATTRQLNGHIRVQATGVANRVYHVEASSNLSPNSFTAIGSTTATSAGVIDCDIVPTPGAAKEFYRFTYP